MAGAAGRGRPPLEELDDEEESDEDEVGWLGVGWERIRVCRSGCQCVGGGGQGSRWCGRGTPLAHSLRSPTHPHTHSQGGGTRSREVALDLTRRIRQELAVPAVLHLYGWLLQVGRQEGSDLHRLFPCMRRFLGALPPW